MDDRIRQRLEELIMPPVATAPDADVEDLAREISLGLHVGDEFRARENGMVPPSDKAIAGVSTSAPAHRPRHSGQGKPEDDDIPTP